MLTREKYKLVAGWLSAKQGRLQPDDWLPPWLGGVNYDELMDGEPARSAVRDGLLKAKGLANAGTDLEAETIPELARYENQQYLDQVYEW